MDKKILGDYNLLKKIGEGPLGMVYLAEHRFIKHQFVLKILPEELATDRNFIQRFEKQVAALASLEHPHIVKVHNISFADGHYFLVTDCIVDSLGETTNLAQYLSHNERRLPEEEVLQILTQIANALDYAHQKKLDGKPLAHRGVKLNNILISEVEGGRNVLLSDFGLGHIVGEGKLLTRLYQVLAEGVGANSPSKLHLSFLQSYAFLAPEQKIAQNSDKVDLKADVYAFGVLAYYLLMRTFPEGCFPMPSTFVREGVCDWDRLIQSCLQPDPLARPTSLRPFLEEIQTKKESAPIKKTPVVAESGKVAVKTMPQTSTTEVVEKIPEFFNVTEAPETLQPVLKPQEISRPSYDPDPGAVFNVESTVAPYKPKEHEVQNVEPLLTEMAVVEGGEYLRGSNEGVRDERPVHKVLIESFALDVHPITNEQIVRFLEAMGGEKDSNNNDIIRLRESRIKRMGGKLIIESGYAKHPVVGVSWYGAVAYAKWIGKRLPTEAEWEIASRGGLPEAIYPTGGHIERNGANFFSADTTAVLSYPPNGYGFYDMAGNVYEWCQDWYDYHYYDTSLQEPENPKGPIQGVYRVLRGGCWKSLQEDMRCAHRHRNNPGTVNKTYGFRCAADVK